MSTLKLTSSLLTAIVTTKGYKITETFICEDHHEVVIMTDEFGLGYYEVDENMYELTLNNKTTQERISVITDDMRDILTLFSMANL